MAIIIRAKGVGKMRPVARVGDNHNCHKITDGPHCGGPIFTGSNFMKADGMSVACVGDRAHCHPCDDYIAEGVESILVGGKPIATVGDKCQHGGIILEGSPNLYIAETLGCSLTEEEYAKMYDPEALVGEHWIQGQYFDEKGKPKTGLSYRIVHDAGVIKQGKLDADGKTEKIQNLPNGTATIYFGDRGPLEQKLINSRERLKQSLNNVLKKEKAATEKERLAEKKEREYYQHAPWYKKLYNYSVSAARDIAALGEGLYDGTKHAIESAGDEAEDAAKDIGKGIVHLYRFEKQQIHILASDKLTLKQKLAAISIEDADAVDNVLSSISDEAKKLYGGLVRGYHLMKILFSDEETRQILESFAEQYYHADTPIMMSKQVGELIGNLIPGIIIAAITKNPELLGPAFAAESTSDLAEAASASEDIADTLEKLKETHQIEEAEVDHVHVIAKKSDGNMLYHTVTDPEHVQNILNKIDREWLNKKSRFGKAFYLSEIPETTLAELNHHNMNGTHTIRYTFNKHLAKIVDLADLKTAEKWNYRGGDIDLDTKMLGLKAKKLGYNVIRYPSERGRGDNIAVLSGFKKLLTPEMVVQAPKIPMEIRRLK